MALEQHPAEQGELYIAGFPGDSDEPKLDVTPDGEGVFPSDLRDGDFQPLADRQAAQEAAAERRRARRAAQIGRHTVKPGSSPKPGDCLPGPDGVQVVTWSNWNAAVAAHRHNQATRATVPSQPLFGDSLELLPEAVFRLPAGNTVAAQQPEKRIWFTLDTISKRLEVIIDQAHGALFIPATKDEITDALPTIERPRQNGAVHDELMATHDHKVAEVLRKGFSRQVADWEAKRAVISRIYEMTDNLADAKSSFDLLHDLQKSVAASHGLPTLSAAEVFADNPRALLGLRVMARDVLIVQLKDQDISEAELGFRAMTAREVRTFKRPELPKSGKTPEEAVAFLKAKAAVEQQVKSRSGNYSDTMLLQRNKTTYSPFAPKSGHYDEKLETYVDMFLEKITIGQLRRTGLSGRLAGLQQNRYWHWRRCVEDVKGNPYAQVTEPLLDTYPPGLQAA